MSWRWRECRNTFQEGGRDCATGSLNKEYTAGAQRPLGMHDMAGLATEIWVKNADVLSVTASKNWVDLHDPHSRKESLSLSFGILLHGLW